jgi:hypothetical protein
LGDILKESCVKKYQGVGKNIEGSEKNPFLSPQASSELKITIISSPDFE